MTTTPATSATTTTSATPAMYEIESRVRYSECDEAGNLSVHALINYLQDCSTFHSEDIGRGVAYMGERHLAWLIAAWQIEIERLPRFCETIRVGTWCHTMSRTLASRNFQVCDADGTRLVRADSLWFVYDFELGRPVRIGDDQRVYLTDIPPLDMPATKRHMRVRGDFREAPAVQVSELHLDTNRHVNNAQYLAMAMGALTTTTDGTALPDTTQLRRICIQYQRQARLGDTICPRVYLQGSASIVDLCNPDGESFATVELAIDNGQ